ncbi:thiosulfate:glutathione sulfurtransferase [Callorhinchus milii]|uniref:Thiosulfate sulfurtransferase/rhodanese-like domain-containing protein 1 n=1 Tax=Callorhinchus milii TaxID=7868 RepID=V9LCD8_CALMI|nr:thiosulfate:glutathione sulfurtransferase [Callorhinchus milii]|eukprot:gi/632937327/ref/XP_007899183.1/ PREDICTED: thiosulfate sulfurtransferase/rhodanese-like domain-containing protein 1 [Callorhinchus milii]
MLRLQSAPVYILIVTLTCNLLYRCLAADVVSYEELRKMVANGNIRLYDVREPEEVMLGKIPTSINIPLNQLKTSLLMDDEIFKKKYKSNKPQKWDTKIVFYCRSGKRSATALKTAKILDYLHARHYEGGYMEWEDCESARSH